MFRIRLASGQEVAFRSVEDLAVGIRNGAVPATAEIFHTKSQQWLPVAVHPVYEQASVRVTGTPGDGNAPEQASTPGDDSVAGYRIYQMVSQSAIELAQRRRSGWLGPTLSLGCAFVVIAGLTWINVPDSTAAADAGRSLVARDMAGAVLSSPFATQGLRTWKNAPDQLALRLARASDSASLQLAARARDLGLGNLLAEDRLASPLRVETTRAALVTFEASLTSYRFRQRARSAAYQDSALTLVQSGAWNQADLDEWAQRDAPAESPEEAARTDSLLTSLDRLYALLFDQEGGYRITTDGVRFTALAAGDEYTDVRRTIQHLVSAHPNRVSRPSATGVLILAMVGDGALPARLDN
jgi:hypothetical protein